MRPFPLRFVMANLFAVFMGQFCLPGVSTGQQAPPQKASQIIIGDWRVEDTKAPGQFFYRRFLKGGNYVHAGTKEGLDRAAPEGSWDLKPDNTIGTKHFRRSQQETITVQGPDSFTLENRGGQKFSGSRQPAKPGKRLPLAPLPNALAEKSNWRLQGTWNRPVKLASEDLDKAWEEYDKVARDVAASIADLIDKEIEAAKRQGSLEKCTYWQSQQKLFAETGVPPSLDHTKQVVDAATEDADKAADRLTQAYEDEIKRLTMQDNIKQATRVEEERHSVRFAASLEGDWGVKSIEQPPPQNKPYSFVLRLQRFGRFKSAGDQGHLSNDLPITGTWRVQNGEAVTEEQVRPGRPPWKNKISPKKDRPAEFSMTNSNGEEFVGTRLPTLPTPPPP